jgi:hypothetical protein
MYICSTGVDKVTGDPAVLGGRQTYRTLNFVVGCFGLNSVLLIDRSIQRTLSVTSLIIVEKRGGGGEGARLFIYVTVL